MDNIHCDSKIFNLDFIRKYMKDNGIESVLDTNNSIESLGIYRIEKKGQKWKINMDGPKDTLFKDGVFQITIDFPDSFPNKRPEVRIVTKIYHLNVSPTNGHMCANFLNNWNTNTTISELLVGIYLFFLLNQNPKSPYSGEMARRYETNRSEFNKTIIEWVNKYASPPLLDQLEKDIKLFNKKISNLEKNDEILKNDLMTMKSILLEKDLKIEYYRDKYTKLLEELKEMKNPNDVKSKQQLISVIFQTNKKDFTCSIICKETDTFCEVECLFYAKFPKFKESEKNFTLNGKKIEKEKTIKENGINDNDIISFD